MLIDRAIIEVSGGNGGAGRGAFRREKYVPKGGPDGGDGGKGGSVFITASNQVSTLFDMSAQRHWSADDGEDGRTKNQYGAAGADLTIKLPPGTLIYDDETGVLLDDLDVEGKTLLVAAGGKGGWGNTRFATATHQTPREAQPGEPGEHKRIRLELKLIADVGFVGKPNAGKSTLLAALSRARPKIADYPFTTREPQLGIAELPGERRLILADIPGLIEGASRGTGLGHEFLRHIERTRILVHLLEPEPADGTNPAENYRVIRNELSAYSDELTQKTEIVALNKLDLIPDLECGVSTPVIPAQAGIQRNPPPRLDAAPGSAGVHTRTELLRQLSQDLALPIHPLSAATGEGCRELLELCWRQLHPGS